MVLIRALPPESLVWAAQERAEKLALKPTPEQIRARQEFYQKQRERQVTDD